MNRRDSAPLTKLERLRKKSQQLPYRTVLNVVPLHTLVELKTEARLTWLRLRRRKIDPRFLSAKNLMVNVGCGSEGLEGWVNFDSSPAPGVTCVRDCRTTLALPSSSARGIFTEHFLEHLDYYEEAPRFLRECRRVLCPGGALRIIVPDGEKYLTAYCRGDMAGMKSFSCLMSFDATSDSAPFSIESEILPFRTKMEVVNFHFRQNGQHRFSYDFETLAQILEDCGFESIVRTEFGSTRQSGLAIDNQQRASESLVVEASVPQ
jgi:hypothetical protein